MEKYSAPRQAQFAQFSACGVDVPLATLNFFWFNLRAQYMTEDPEYGTDSADVSGEEAFAAYGVGAGAVITGLGGRFFVGAAVDQVMIGPETHN